MEDQDPQREACIGKGLGQYVYDNKGARYIDCVNSVAHVGHCEPRVNSVTCKAMKWLTPSVPYNSSANRKRAKSDEQTRDHHYTSTPYEHAVKETLPRHLDTVLFCDSGSEAVDLSVRISRLWCAKYKGNQRFNPNVPCGFMEHSTHSIPRGGGDDMGSPQPHQYNKYVDPLEMNGCNYGSYSHSNNQPTGDILVVEGSFHGCSNSMRDFSSRLPDKREHGQIYTPDVHIAPMPDVYRVTQSDRVKTPHDDGVTAAVQRHLLITNQMLDMVKTSNRELSCFLCEPLLTIQGAVYPPPAWLQGMYRMTRELFPGALCITDEVQSGMGRLGEHFWGFQAQDVIPDIVVAGKSLGNGFPMAMVITSKAIADVLGPAKEMYFCSQVHNNIGSSVFDVINTDQVMQKALSTGIQLKYLLQSLKKKHDNVGDVRGVGLLHAIEIVWSQKQKKPSREIAEFLVHKLRRRGVVIVRDGIHKNILIIMPPMTFDDLDAASLVTKLDEVLLLIPHNFNPKLGNVSKDDFDHDENFPGSSSSKYSYNPHNPSSNSSNNSSSQNNQGTSSSNCSNSGRSSLRRELHISNHSNNEQLEDHYNSSSSNASYSQSSNSSYSQCPPSTSNSNSNQFPSDLSDDDELVDRLRTRKDIFSNIVFVERNCNHDLLSELESTLNNDNEDENSRDSTHSLKKTEKVTAEDNDEQYELHPDEKPRNSGIPTFGMGMIQPLSINLFHSGYLKDIFPNEEMIDVN